MNSLLPNSDLNWKKQGKPVDHSGMTIPKAVPKESSDTGSESNELWTGSESNALSIFINQDYLNHSGDGMQTSPWHRQRQGADCQLLQHRPCLLLSPSPRRLHTTSLCHMTYNASWQPDYTSSSTGQTSHGTCCSRENANKRATSQLRGKVLKSMPGVLAAPCFCLGHRDSLSRQMLLLEWENPCRNLQSEGQPCVTWTRNKHSLLKASDLLEPCVTVAKLTNTLAQTSLVVRWLGICQPVKGTRVWSLVQEDCTCCASK